MSQTALDIINGAYEEYNVIPVGGTLAAAQSAAGLLRLQDLIDQLQADGLSIFTVATLTLTSTGASTYTLGTSGTFSSTWYADITSAWVRVGGVDYPIDCTWTADQYAAVPQKALSQTFPAGLYYDKGFPTGTLYYAPIPSSGTALYLNAWAPLTSPSATSTVLSTAFPPAYISLLKYGLARRLAAPLGYPVPASVEQLYQEARTLVQRRNLRPQYVVPDAVVPRSGGGGLNWRTGEPYGVMP